LSVLRPSSRGKLLTNPSPGRPLMISERLNCIRTWPLSAGSLSLAVFRFPSVPSLYLLLKALHLIFIVTWFAGIFYMPRLLIYHGQSRDPAARATFETMESKLYRIIMNPSMIVTLVLGLSLMILQWSSIQHVGWLWIKLTLVAVLLVYHHYCAALIKKFAAARNSFEQPVSDRFLRVFNEIPALLLIIIVLLAVTKPF
jgi:protoporphyrinogen IX oxidase